MRPAPWPARGSCRPCPGWEHSSHPRDGENWFEEQEQLINTGLIQLASTRITSRMPLQGNAPRNFHLEAVLMPSARMASYFRSALADRRAFPDPAGPKEQG